MEVPAGKSRPPDCARAVRGRDLGPSAWLALAPDEEVRRGGGVGTVGAVEAGAPSGLGSRRSGRVGRGGDCGDGGSRAKVAG